MSEISVLIKMTSESSLSRLCEDTKRRRQSATQEESPHLTLTMLVP